MTLALQEGLAGVLGRPLLILVLLGALAGLVGVLAVTHQRVFYAESITHGTFPGAVLGVVLGAQLGLGQDGLAVALMVGAAAMCLPLAWLMHRLARTPGVTPQAAAGIVLTFGFALGYFLNTWFAPLPLKIESFLTGSVLTVTRTDVLAAAVVLALVVIMVVALWRPLFFLAFDPQGFAAVGLRAGVLHAVVLFSITATLVVVIPAVGTILAIALVAAPAAGLVPLVHRPQQLLLAAPLAGIAIGVVGLLLAVWWNFSAGGTIALVAGVFYVACRVLASRQHRTHTGDDTCEHSPADACDPAPAPAAA
ncbi:zinc ABC transporter permease [Corynebacterium sp. 13CS0277]|nr:metal ABC transporter permease [Corynebacterium sp. 13CS0277]PRQ11373.1 zinc ABC transporter permease [Corynebacterium sp. 13CS0277]